MKIILKQDIRGKGKKGQMIEAAEGYARNYLIPRGLAVEATADAVNTMNLQAKAKAKATAKAKGDPEAAKAAATAEVNGLAVDMVVGLLPDVLRQGGEISYKLLAALDGQTLEEYKADFTVKKWVNDIKDAIDGIDGIKDVLAPFFG